LIFEKRGEAGYYKLTQEMTRQWTEKQTKRTQPQSASLNSEMSLQQPTQGELL
jgi:hypothetical protein